MADRTPGRTTGTARRTFLAAVGAGVPSGLAGCSLGLGADRSAEADGRWSQQTTLTPEAGSRVFGRSVALASDTALVGSMADEAYVF